MQWSKGALIGAVTSTCIRMEKDSWATCKVAIRSSRTNSVMFSIQNNVNMAKISSYGVPEESPSEPKHANSMTKLCALKDCSDYSLENIFIYVTSYIALAVTTVNNADHLQ